MFSFFLGFGLYDPFGTNGLYLDVFTILAVISVILSNGFFNAFRKSVKEVKILFLIAITLFLSAVIYGISFQNIIPINFKFISAIIIFWLFSNVFADNTKTAVICMVLFSISCGLISLGYVFGLFSNEVEILNGRLRFFGENPNSVSSRMAISFIIIYYLALFNPLKLSKIRYLTLLFLPFLTLFIIDTGSRGSLLILILSILFLALVSKIKWIYKFLLVLISIGVTVFMYIIVIKDSAIMERFLNEGLTDSRDDLWGNAFSIFLNNPILGVGEEGYKIEAWKISNRVLDTHNLFLYFLVTGGFIAFILFMLFLLRLIKKAVIQLRNQNTLPFLILFFFIFLMSKTGGIITYLVMWFFLAYINSFPYKISKNSFS